MQRIMHVCYPFVILETGEELRVDDFENTPSAGQYASKTDKGYKAVRFSDSECVGGVCPIK